jgi:hypothetical protein
MQQISLSPIQLEAPELKADLQPKRSLNPPVTEVERTRRAAYLALTSAPQGPFILHERSEGWWRSVGGDDAISIYHHGTDNVSQWLHKAISTGQVTVSRAPHVDTEPRPSNSAAIVAEKASKKIAERWGLSDDDLKIILDRATLDSGGHFRDLYFTRDQGDRLRLLIEIYDGVYSLFRNPEAERTWIRHPREELSDRSVLDLMLDGSFMLLYRAKVFIVTVNGR